MEQNQSYKMVLRDRSTTSGSFLNHMKRQPTNQRSCPTKRRKINKRPNLDTINVYVAEKILEYLDSDSCEAFDEACMHFGLIDTETYWKRVTKICETHEEVPTDIAKFRKMQLCFNTNVNADLYKFVVPASDALRELEIDRSQWLKSLFELPRERIFCPHLQALTIPMSDLCLFQLPKCFGKLILINNILDHNINELLLHLLDGVESIASLYLLNDVECLPIKYYPNYDYTPPNPCKLRVFDFTCDVMSDTFAYDDLANAVQAQHIVLNLDLYTQESSVTISLPHVSHLHISVNDETPLHIIAPNLISLSVSGKLYFGTNTRLSNLQFLEMPGCFLDVSSMPKLQYSVWFIYGEINMVIVDKSQEKIFGRNIKDGFSVNQHLMFQDVNNTFPSFASSLDAGTEFEKSNINMLSVLGGQFEETVNNWRAATKNKMNTKILEFGKILYKTKK